jgi:hypothetical protein
LVLLVTFSDDFGHIGVVFIQFPITARCAWGKREGMKSKRECHYTRELDLETLVWTRGANFPLSSLDGRLMCPRCRSRRVVVMFQPPTMSRSAITPR